MNKAFRDLWDGQPCYLQIPGICQGQATAPAHSNESRHGKGKSIKAHDCFTCPACEACHRAIDSGKNLSREERTTIWRNAWERWILFIFQTGLVVVAGEKAVVHGSYTPIPKIFKRQAT